MIVMGVIMTRGGHVLATGQECPSLQVSYQSDSAAVQVTGSHSHMANLTAL